MGNERNNTNNPWPGLVPQAQADTLQLSRGAALEGAKLAAIAANALIFAKSYQELLTQHKGFSDNNHLEQIVMLKVRFNDQGGRLGAILDHYIELVNAMADTMIQADKTYDAHEEDAAAKFNRLKHDADSADTDPAKPAMQRGTIPDLPGDSTPRLDQDKKGHPALYDIAHEAGHYDAIDPENPFGHDSLDWFYLAGEGMNPQLVADFGATWKKVADKVDKSFDALNKQLVKMVNDKEWTGAGAQGAIDAANAFKDQASELTDDLRAMASNLTYVSGWLDNTKVMMPRNKPTDFDYDHYQRMENMIKAAQLAFQHWYVPGLIGASQAVPKLSDATVAKPSLDAPTRRSDLGGGGGQNNGGVKNRLGDGSMPNLGNMPNNKINPNGANPNGTNPNGTNPNGTNPNGTNPNGTNPNGVNPNGTNPNGTNPNGTNPNGTHPNGTNPQGNPSGTNPNSNTGQSSQGMSQLSSALQQGMQGLTSLQSTEQQKKQQQELKDKLKDSPLAGMPNLEDLKKGLGGGGGGGGGGAGPAKPAEPSRLFPRAAVESLEVSASGVARAGIAAGPTAAGGMGGGGGMGPMGHGAGGHGGAGGKEHKRPEFLDSSEHLDAAMGTAPIVAKPVVEG
ncbi:WXG100 family type VII secretion target [Nocardia tengchongensis]|uniref:WXG100 family type VII secretion target n=1 Tax=Nocardia tengchongensis TaxID=2055889 RepID=UPI00365FF88E